MTEHSQVPWEWLLEIWILRRIPYIQGRKKQGGKLKWGSLNINFHGNREETSKSRWERQPLRGTVFKKKKGKHSNPLNFPAAEAMLFSIAADIDKVFSCKKKEEKNQQLFSWKQLTRGRAADGSKFLLLKQNEL